MGLLALVVISLLSSSSALLHPQESESREIISLDGLWLFKISPQKDPEAGYHELWYKEDFTELGDYFYMPVPASFNDITANITIREFVGVVWYQRSFFIPERWQKFRVVLRFESVHYQTNVWLNSKKMGNHSGGHLPFEFELPWVIPGKNVLTVAVNNTLTNNTIPQGYLVHPQGPKYPAGTTLYSHEFDYFDYAGINRKVYLYTTPVAYISDIVISTEVASHQGRVKYEVKVKGEAKNCWAVVKTASGMKVASSEFCKGELNICSPNLWWPRGMGHDVGYLYTFEASVTSEESTYDVYRLKFGIRTIETNGTSILINKQPVYLHGFGMHEDWSTRGRGFDWSMLMRDMNLLEWVGANTVRTSHYPYSTEFLQRTDELGIMVISESPACSLSYFDTNLLNLHIQIMSDLVERDRNHPSVIMWSLANEPDSSQASSSDYFRKLYKFVKKLDPDRPVTFVTSHHTTDDKAVGCMDVICLNRYYGWYEHGGRDDLITLDVEIEINEWHQKYKKPVIQTEYGAGSVTGLHTVPATMWSEEYQTRVLKKHFEAFDVLRRCKKLSGELIWNFADFLTPQEYFRPGACAKGVFTRDRQPKLAALTARGRFHNLLQEAERASHFS